MAFFCVSGGFGGFPRGLGGSRRVVGVLPAGIRRLPAGDRGFPPGNPGIPRAELGPRQGSGGFSPGNPGISRVDSGPPAGIRGSPRGSGDSPMNFWGDFGISPGKTGVFPGFRDFPRNLGVFSPRFPHYFWGFPNGKSPFPRAFPTVISGGKPRNSLILYQEK